RPRELTRPDQLVAFPAGRAGSVPFAVVASSGADEPLRALVVTPEAIHLEARVLLRLLLLVRERVPEVVDDQLALGGGFHGVLRRRHRARERLDVALPFAEADLERVQLGGGFGRGRRRRGGGRGRRRRRRGMRRRCGRGRRWRGGRLRDGCGSCGRRRRGGRRGGGLRLRDGGARGEGGGGQQGQSRDLIFY